MLKIQRSTLGSILSNQGINMQNQDIQKFNSNGVMSAVTVFNQVAYLSGQVPKITTPDIALQTKDVLNTIDALLAQVGTDKSRLLSAQVFVKNLEDFQIFNQIWIEWMEDLIPPSRATIQADLVNPEWLIEIAVIAALK